MCLLTVFLICLEFQRARSTFNQKSFSTPLTWNPTQMEVSLVKLPQDTLTPVFNIHGSVHPKNILIYIQQDATLHSLLYVESALNVSGCTSTHHQERIQLYLQHLVFVTPLLLPAAIAAGSSNSVTNTRCCRYCCMRSWWWVEVTLETCRAVSRYK